MKTFLSAIIGSLVGGCVVALVVAQGTGIPGVFPGTFSTDIRNLLPPISATPYTPVLAGAGAGNVSNGTHRYVITLSDTGQGVDETAAGVPSPAVTVVNNTINGQVSMPIPGVCDGPFGFVQIYRDKNSDGVFRYVTSSAYNCGVTLTDNVADGSLGPVAPSAGTALSTYNVGNQTINAPLSGGPISNLALPQFGGAGTNGIFPFDTPKGNGASFVMWGGAGSGNSGQGAGDLKLEGGWVNTDSGLDTTHGGVVIVGISGATGAPYTVAALPPCSMKAGARAVVSNSSATLTAGIGAVVMGGGANVVPVVCDGTNWRIG